MPKRADRAATKPPPDPKPDDLPDAMEEESDSAAAPIEDEEVVGLEEAQAEDNFFGLWYGVPGTGKTTDICRILLARPVGNLLVCNAEGGLKLRALRAQGIPVDRIRVWPKPGVRPTFDSLERLVLKVESDLAAARRDGQPAPYCAFALDSVTELVKLMLDNVLEEGIAGQRELDRRARAAGVNPPRRNIRTRFATDRDDYGLVANQMRAILRKLRYLPLDLLVTGLVRRDEDQDTGVTMYGPAAPPALQADLIGYADVVIRTERRDNEKGAEQFVGYTRPDANHHGKDRYGVLPLELLPPGADVVLGHITGEVVDSADSSPAGAEDEDTAPADPQSTEEPASEEPATKAAPARRRTSKATPASSKGRRGRIDAKTMTAVGEGDGSTDEPPF